MSSTRATWLGVDRRATSLVLAGLLLGAGLGGFFDGIVFHQILQWHHMGSAHPDPSVAGDLRTNVFLDGLFHAVTYVVTTAGIVQLWRARRAPAVPASGGTLFGATLAGWGLFNLVEGLLIHQLLGLHHVRPAGPGPTVLWDAAYLAWGVLFLAGGYVLVRRDDAAARPPESDRPGDAP